MAVPLLEPKGIPTMFGEVFENNVAFCVDTSGSMYKGLDVVKEHLIETLLKHGSRSKPTMFNIIEFNSEVTQWSDKMVTCTPQTVAVAKDWINKLCAKTGTNTKDALLTALSDPRCDAVYLVTDGLPDHHPVEILDHVGNVGKCRPVHCIYLSTEETTECAAIEFLEDLAIESYGSFHIVTLTTHGCVEKVTPIYRAEHAQERIVRTLNGTIRPNTKTCSVATTLQVDPEESLNLTPRVSHAYPYAPYYAAPWLNWMSLPYRYYFPHAWARYRPARGWMKSQEQMMETTATSDLSPAAGALLINKRILARRIDDGYFYLGTVKSQILSDKFLVAFGPCKHGRFKETMYQDTYIYDIIDYEDAKRHTILTGDKVLAPWEPEGERYGPGSVIEGHEKRQAEGPDDKVIVVSFTNGKVEKVPRDTALWIPTMVYERLELELKMPKEAREALSSEENYPQETLEGYPTSGVIASPESFEQSQPVYLDGDPLLIDGRPWRNPYFPHYPLIFKRGQEKEKLMTTTTKSEVKSEDINALIPGTDMTQKELGDKVMSQLVEHKLILDEKETEKGTKKAETGRDSPGLDSKSEQELRRRLEQRRRETELEYELEREREREKLLKKREKQEENTLKKSVSFRENSMGDIKVEDLEKTEEEKIKDEHKERRQATAEQDYVPYFREATEIPSEETINTRDLGVNTDASLLFRPQSKLVSRPPWKKYWRADPGMPTKSLSQGPFRETALQAPLEARCQRPDPYIAEWTSPVYSYVDPYARHDYSNSVEKLLTKPVPPMKPEKPIPPPEPLRPMSAESKEAARREYKRRKVVQRQTDWNNKLQHQDQMKEVMQDQHRERIQAQLAREKERQIMEQRMVEQARESKKHISTELRQKIEANQKREHDKEQQRIAAMARRRDHREEIQRQREKAIEETVKRRNEIKAQRSQQRWDQVERRLDAEEKENMRKSEQFHNAKVNRIQHFQRLEEEGQRRKDLRIGMTDRHLSMFQSTVLP